jgi:hypothetical protein
MWELRTSTSLARLWQSQGKRQDAYELLAPVFHWFTESSSPSTRPQRSCQASAKWTRHDKETQTVAIRSAALAHHAADAMVDFNSTKRRTRLFGGNPLDETAATRRTKVPANTSEDVIPDMFCKYWCSRLDYECLTATEIRSMISNSF